MRIAQSFLRQVALSSRGFSTMSAGKKVAILGASGGIGQPLSLLMKLNKNVGSLALYDIANVKGVAADLSHIDTPAVVTAHQDASSLTDAVKGADVILIPAGVPRKPGMTRDDLFSINAGIVASLAESIAKHAKDATVMLITNPVNSTVPIFAEVMKKAKVYNPRKLIGVTELDLVRASTFVSEAVGKPAGSIRVNVVGGHSGTTIVPLISQTGVNLPADKIKQITHRIQFGGDEIVEAKAGAGSATLSMAHAGAKAASLVIESMVENKPVTITGFVENDLYSSQGISFFATRLDVTHGEVTKVYPVGEMTEDEKLLFNQALSGLNTNINKGIKFATTGKV